MSATPRTPSLARVRRLDVPRLGRGIGRSGRWLVAGCVLGIALLTGVMIGPAGLTASGVALELVNAIPGVTLDSGLTSQQQAILWQIRLPRMVLGALVGATLAVAGAAYQGVFRNPLADPYLLGVSAGAGLGATLAITQGGGIGPFGVPLAAFAGGLLAVSATYALGASVGGHRSSTIIVLAGVAVAAFFSAVQTFVQQWFDDSLLAVYSWMLGRLSTNGWSDVIMVLPYVLASWVLLLLHRRTLDVLAVGDVEAASLGINVPRVRLVLVLVATLGTTAVVAVSGLIGFVGIVVPHAVRLIFGTSHRLLLPLAMLFGAAFLVLADVAARSVVAPAELPIGVVTAFVGAPFFLVVLRRNRSMT
ncbi:FecCD family ABC transporter permease [Propioniciclava soli]|uniref:FecCD family ABC transporter permease n=1 Tax=Propioniciclava soli TaxID=2775081 RepID=UPI001E477185|nr:iron ABC transporter permease [Propioniciclava soli]